MIFFLRGASNETYSTGLKETWVTKENKKKECTTSMSERAQSLSYVIYDVLNNVIKEAQTFNCLGKGGASNILKKNGEKKDQSNGP